MDFVITTNGPGEISTWVIPFVEAVKKSSERCNIWVFLTPCMFAGGNEEQVLVGLEEITGVFKASELLGYLVPGIKPRAFSPSDSGAVICLGGDTIYAGLLSKRLGYRCYAYCERAAGRINDKFTYFVSTGIVLQKLVKKGADPEKVIVAGRISYEAVRVKSSSEKVRERLCVGNDKLLLNILPGSRYSMFELSVEFFFNAAWKLPDDFSVMLTIAPYISIDQVKRVLDKSFGCDWKIISREKDTMWVVIKERPVILFFGNQYEAMACSNLAVALPGSNNMELAALNIPTFVVLPLNYPEKIPVPGVLEYICRIPIIGKIFKAKIIFPKILRKFNYVSPFNREIGFEIFPEMVGVLKPEEIQSKIEEICYSKLGEISEMLEKTYKTTGVSEFIVNKILKEAAND
jgi:hypothetical protein